LSRTDVVDLEPPVLHQSEPCLHGATRDACRAGQVGDGYPLVGDHPQEVRPEQERWLLGAGRTETFEVAADVEQRMRQQSRQRRHRGHAATRLESMPPTRWGAVLRSR